MMDFSSPIRRLTIPLFGASDPMGPLEAAERLLEYAELILREDPEAARRAKLEAERLVAVAEGRLEALKGSIHAALDLLEAAHRADKEVQ